MGEDGHQALLSALVHDHPTMPPGHARIDGALQSGIMPAWDVSSSVCHHRPAASALCGTRRPARCRRPRGVHRAAGSASLLRLTARRDTMKSRLALGALLLGLLGCTPAYHWEKPHVTAAELARDRSECAHETQESGSFGARLLGPTHRPSAYDRCLAARGYQKVKHE